MQNNFNKNKKSLGRGNRVLTNDIKKIDANIANIHISDTDFNISAKKNLASDISSKRTESTDSSSSSKHSKTSIKSKSISRPNINPIDNLSESIGTPKIESLETKIPLCANYIPLTFDENRLVHLYSVTFEPDIDNNVLKQKILYQTGIDGIENGIFSGNLFYTFKKLKRNKYDFEADISKNTGQSLQVSISYTKSEKMFQQIALINIIFKKVLKILNLKLIGKSYCNSDMCTKIDKLHLSILPGFVTSIRNYGDKVLLVIDVSHRVLRNDTVYMHFDAIYQEFGSDNFKDHCIKNLIGQTIITRYNNRTYRIDDIEWDKTPKSKFLWKDKKISYVDYYKDVYGIDIVHLDQPLLINYSKSALDKKKRSSFDMKEDNESSNDQRLICLIPELSNLTGIDEKMRSNFTKMRELSSYIHPGPDQRLSSIQKFLDTLHQSEKAVFELEKWGIKLGLSMMKVNGKVLKNEKLICGHGRTSFTVDPRSGWVSKISNHKLLNPVDIGHWLCIFPTRDKGHVIQFVNRVITCGTLFGMKINPPKYIELADDRILNYVSSIRDNLSPRCMLVMAICHSRREDKYAAIKRVCCCDNPIPSQIIMTPTISRPNKLQSIAQRVCMQMNCKLGGELWAVKIPTNSIMAIGYDVSHFNSDKKTASVLGFVSSINSTFTKWFTSVEFQAASQEITTSPLRKCITKAMQKYVEFNGSPPKKVIVYRDGVGHGQVEALRHFELTAFQNTLAEFDSKDEAGKTYTPSLIFCIIRKRIKTRLFIDSMNVDSSGNNQYISDSKQINPPSGTIIDHSITDQTENMDSFFLVSQHFNQGTIQPACFSILYNNSKLTTEHIQKLTYKFTYLYYNWPNTIKVPAPCQYSHRAAHLVGQVIRKDVSMELADKLYYL